MMWRWTGPCAALVLALASFPPAVGRAAAEPKPDLVVINARIVDGSGNAWLRGGVAVRDGRIVAVGAVSPKGARRVIDARERVIAPGFIDTLGQQTAVYLYDRVAVQSKLRQGITTHVSGEGWSHAPQNERTQSQRAEKNGEKFRWRDYATYFSLLEQRGVAVNVVHNVGAMQVRQVVMGDEDREPTAAELEKMKQLVANAMIDGANGLSSALIYAPGAYAKTEELIALAEVAGRHGGIYSTHLRNESGRLLEAIDEAIRIGRQARVAVHIYHLKAAGRDHWPLMEKAVARIEDARRQGLDITADIYPYTRNGLDLRSFLDPRHYAKGIEAFMPTVSDPAVRLQLRQELEAPGPDWENWYQHAGRDWDKVLIDNAGAWLDPTIAGLSIAQAASRASKDTWEMFFDLIQTPGVHVTPETMDEAQKRLALRAPWVMIETDREPINPAVTRSTHPRAFGAFARVLARYVREEGVLTLEEAVRRMTSLPANRMGLWDRGRIAPGMAADLVIFDSASVSDRATYTEPLQYAEGIDHVVVNGQLVIDDGRMLDVLPGQVLRHRSPLR